MHAPALGSAAATLAVSLIYLVSPSAPDARLRVTRAGTEVPRTAEWPEHWERGSTSAPLAQGRDCTAFCADVPARANQHWTEYLEFRRTAGSAAGNEPRKKAKP